MKRDQIHVGGFYVAKVNNGLTVVRVDAINSVYGGGETFHVTNTATKRTTVFRSAAKFRREACATCQKVNCSCGVNKLLDNIEESVDAINQLEVVNLPTEEGEECPDPTVSVAAQVAADPAPATGLASRLAARIAAAQVTTPIAKVIAGMTPTEEQARGLEIAQRLFALRATGFQVLALKAGAGAGKTAELRMIEQILVGIGQYTAFNSSLVTESKPKFVKASCNTTHSLAYRAVGYKFNKRLKSPRVKSYQIAQMLGLQDVYIPSGEPYPVGSHEWKEAAAAAGSPLPDGFAPRPERRLKAAWLAGQVMQATKRFCQSADRELAGKHVHVDGVDYCDRDGNRVRDNSNRLREHLLPFAKAAWADLTNTEGSLQFSHDVYVKLWQLGEGAQRPVIAADYILLDEYQDTAEVFIDVLMQQKHALLVLVGDDNQRVYEWRGAKNAADYFPQAEVSWLTQSFRFGQTFADVANSILGTLEEKTDLVMRGLPSIPSRVCEVKNPCCCIYRTNAGAVGHLMRDYAAGKRDHLIGGTKEVIGFCRAAMDLQNGQGTDHPELGCFSNWTEVVEYSKEDEGEDLRLMVKLINDFGAAKIRTALENMPSEDDAHCVLTTAHRSKGREWRTVKLGGDFKTANRLDDAERRLLYVAATRGQEELDITVCPPFCGGYEKPGGGGEGGQGEWIPGLKITYTVPMPSEAELEAYRAAKNAAKAAPAAGGPPANGTAPNAAAAGLGTQDGQPAAAAPAPQPAADPNYRWVASPLTTGSRWCIRGPACDGFERGKKVMVASRQGNKQIILYSVIHKNADHWLYGIDA